MIVRVADREIACIVTGDGPAVVWIHAFPLNSGIFRGQLTIPGFRHISPDLPGFGGSHKARPMESIEEMGQMIAELMHTLGETKFLVAGVSMGGYIALATLRVAPDQVAAMILMDTREIADSDQGRATRYQQIAQIREEGTAPLAESMVEKLVAPYAARELKAEVRGMIEEASPAGVMAALEAMAERPDSTRLLAGSAGLETLVIVGEDDAITPPSEAERLAGVSGGRLERIPGAGHLACLEQSEIVNAAIMAFLEEVV